MVTTLAIKRLRPNAKMPTKGTEHSACWDLHACLEWEDDPFVVHHNELVKVPTGLQLAIPIGWEMVIRPKSGFGLSGMIIPNSPPTIDSDYRYKLIKDRETGEVIGRKPSELFILLYRLKASTIEPFIIQDGDKIAQFTLKRIEEFTIEEVDEIEPLDTRSGGFGSTGK